MNPNKPKITITWSADGRADLREFGIEIPLLASRSQQILDHLRQNHPDLWLSEHFQKLSATPLEPDLLTLAHSPAYVEAICGPDGGQKIAECYELFDDQGRPNRYDPAKSKRPLQDLTTYQRKEADLTVQSARLALQNGFVYFLGGGMHHASRDHGRGFCLINDVVIAARHLQKTEGIKNVWVIDDDVHKGDGTASICRLDDSIITLSIHMAKGWPLDEPRTLKDGTPNPAHCPSDIDIGIDVGEESEYVPRLKAGLLSMQKQFEKPDFIIVVNGSDPYEKDILPSTRPLRLNLNQMLERDRVVYEFAEGLGVPQLWLMAGGYGPEVWQVHAKFLDSLLAVRLDP